MRVRAEGHADGVGVQARAQAEAATVEAALLQVLATWVARDDVRALAPLLRRPARYVGRVDVLQHYAAGGNTRIEADVFLRTQLLGEEVAAAMLPALPERPRVWLLIGEPGPDGHPVLSARSGALGELLAKPLEKAKMNVAGTGLGDEVFDEATLTAALQGDDEAARRIAVSKQADAVAIGAAKIVAEPPAPGTNVQRYRLTLPLKIYRALDGSLSEVVQEDAAVYGTRQDNVYAPLIADVAVRMGRPLATAVVLTLLSRRTDDAISLTVESPGSRERLANLVAYLEQLPGVQAVDLLYYAEHLARLRVEASASMMDLTDALRDRSFDARSVGIRRVVERDLVLALR